LRFHVYYNEIDPYAAQWLRNLIAAGHIPSGDVDTRDIRDVRPRDLAGYRQCHFFAGIGGWAYALALAAWPADREIWTGSCPCQPFSAAGGNTGFADERHLWPAWFHLIRQRRPAAVIGEQVEAAVKRNWLGLVFADLESEGYACGAAVLPACGVGAPHIRQRLWFVADADGRDTGTEGLQRGGKHGQRTQDGSADKLADADAARCGAGRAGEAGNDGAARLEPSGFRADGSMVNAESKQVGFPGRARQPRATPWSDLVWLPCSDGKARPTEPGIFPLAHGVPARVGKLRAAGNAIVPQTAAEFVKAFLECPLPAPHRPARQL
jgi:DNA (cytosine-5)-methyltransferase 1